MRGKEDAESFPLARDEGMTVGEAADFAGVGRKTGRAWSAFGFTWRGRGRRATAGFLAIWKNNAFETEKTPVWHENARRGSKAGSFAAQYATYSVKPSINLVIGARLSVEFVPKREKDGRGGGEIFQERLPPPCFSVSKRGCATFRPYLDASKPARATFRLCFDASKHSCATFRPCFPPWRRRRVALPAERRLIACGIVGLNRKYVGFAEQPPYRRK